jgi:hypothetical protein
MCQREGAFLDDLDASEVIMPNFSIGFPLLKNSKLVFMPAPTFTNVPEGIITNA